MRRSLSILLGLGMLTSCTNPTDPPSELWVEHVDYRFDVSWSRAVATEDGWLFASHEGYAVRILSWTLQTTSMELVTCEDDPYWWALLLSSSSTAHAHGTYEHDASVIEGAWTEDLADASVLALGDITVQGRYCEGFTVHATGEVGGVMSHITGTYRSPDTDHWTAFDAETTLPVSGLAEVGTGSWDFERPPDDAEVTWTRHPVLAFDALDLDSLSSSELAFEATSELARTATLSWVVGPP